MLVRSGLLQAIGMGRPRVVAVVFDHEPAFAEVVGGGRFDVHVLAGVAGEDGGGGVPVVGRGDDDGVHGLVVEDAAHVAIHLGANARGGGGGLGGGAHAVL